MSVRDHHHTDTPRAQGLHPGVIIGCDVQGSDGTAWKVTSIDRRRHEVAIVQRDRGIRVSFNTLRLNYELIASAA